MGLRNVYVIDDDDVLRKALVSLLSVRSDLLVRTFRSGEEFFESATEQDAAVILVDHNMPGMSGLDLISRTSLVPGRYATIMLTGCGNISLAVAAMKGGAFDFLEKPYDPAFLLALIDQAFVHLDMDSSTVKRKFVAKNKISELSPRETDVLKGLIEGRSNKVIAHDLNISPRTVEIYRANMMDKLDVRSLSEALRVAFMAGLLSAA
ncbi:response regulator transcription factor [Sphingomonas glacialis]|uniref:Response regulator n=1 Tax=Sphingomonas glacialis TaxID=658225 RepID=A0A502FW61_9SPHN|nr:response regulator [Sphingomonas glacialis]TPG53887.1 response regulator [Sphingomonas glacialis]